MGAVGEAGEVLGRGAGRPVAGFCGVEPALEGGDARAAGIGAGELEAGAALLVSAGGLESIWVVGAVVSTVQLKEAGLPSALPALSIARTSNSWAPSASPA